MFVITRKNDNVIIKISQQAENVENGLFVGDCVLADAHLFNTFNLEDVPQEIKEEEYCYDSETGFYKNENYLPPQNLEEEVLKLRNENQQLKESIADLWEVVLIGGAE